MKNIPNLDALYEEVVAYVQEHQGEKGYIDCQPYQENPGDIIYTFEYNEESGWGEERMVYGVRVEDGELQICFEPYMRTCHLVYDEMAFNGEYEGEYEDANAEWYSVRWSDVIYYVPTLFNIAQCIEEYGE